MQDVRESGNQVVDVRGTGNQKAEIAKLIID
jgi:hypothetical protein